MLDNGLTFVFRNCESANFLPKVLLRPRKKDVPLWHTTLGSYEDRF